VAASRDGGTNLLGCSPIDLIAPCFGVNSFAEHASAAKRAGVEPGIFACRSIIHDIDQPRDLSCFRARHQTQTGTRLAQWFGQAQMFEEAALAQ
jgi:2-phospho-L-lactate guanylyltransferase (CobY/MobA/RfbA family)